MRHWMVVISYRTAPAQWRENVRVGVVAPDIEEAIALAKSHGVPVCCDTVRVWSVTDRGKIDVIAEQGE